MSKAEGIPTTDGSEEEWALEDVEAVLVDLESEIAIFGHLSQQHTMVGRETWQRLEDALNESHRKLKAMFDVALRRSEVELAENAALLKAARKDRAAPGSVKDVQHAENQWHMLRLVARLALDRAEERDIEDAELIGLCDRLLSIDVEQDRIHTANPDGPEDVLAPLTDPLDAEWVKIEGRLIEIGRPKTAAGAEAMARVARQNSDRSSTGIPVTSDLSHWLALTACAYLSGDPAPLAAGDAPA